MKYLIISDFHLTKKFDSRRYTQMKALFESVDKIILNGDLWESWANDFSDFINSNWSDLFELMKEKDTVYIYGNHDWLEDSDDRVNLFSVEQTHEFRFNSGEKSFVVRHGHLISKFNPNKSFLRKKFGYFLSHFEKLTILISGSLIQRFYSRQQIKDHLKFAKSILKENEWLICGHTHVQMRKEKERYLNTGFNRFNYFEYAIIQNGEIKLVKDNLY